MRTYDYIIVLKKTNLNRVNQISQLMLVLAVIAFIGSFIAGRSSNILGLVISLLILGWWIFCYTQQKRNIDPSYRFALLLAATGWYFQKDGIWFSLVYLICAMLEKPAKVPDEIAFDETEIVTNHFPKKRYQWNEFNNVILKDGLLTLDFKNNQLIQKKVDAEVSKDVEAEFNEFATKQLTKDLNNQL